MGNNFEEDVIRFRIDGKQKAAFEKICKRRDTVMSRELRLFIKKFIAEDRECRN
jgi:antitoxin component of RelBE/YafQ-DinJ toxin-antitoxin module